VKLAAGLATIVVGATVVAAAPTAAASAAQFCDELAAVWDGANCVTTVESNRNARMTISLALPDGLLDNPVAGPVLREYYGKLINAWRRTGATMVRDSRGSAYVESYPGPGSVQSVVVHEVWWPDGVQANNAYRSFIFDMAQGRRLALADIFKSGVDPLQVIPPAARPLLPAALDAAPPPHQPGTYPFTVQEWEPSPSGSGFSGDYRGWALSAGELILRLPDAPMAHEYPIPRDRFVWSMDGGVVTIRVPLAALATSLRPEYGGS
jgi:hypothetical protein